MKPTRAEPSRLGAHRACLLKLNGEVVQWGRNSAKRPDLAALDDAEDMFREPLAGTWRSSHGVVEPVEGRGPEHYGRHSLAVPSGSLGLGEEAEPFGAGQVVEQLLALAG